MVTPIYIYIYICVCACVCMTPNLPFFIVSSTAFSTPPPTGARSPRGYIYIYIYIYICIYIYIYI